MPLYEYTCSACQNKFDHLARSMSAPAPVPCPACGSDKTVRALSLFSAGSSSPAPTSAPSGGCGRCGGPNPCSLD